MPKWPSNISHSIIIPSPALRASNSCFTNCWAKTFTTVKIDLLKGEGFSKTFREKNPNHAVPVIDIDYADGTTQTLIESIAILTFLADAYPEKGLAPAIDDYAARAEYLKWLAFGGAWMDMMLWKYPPAQRPVAQTNPQP